MKKEKSIRDGEGILQEIDVEIDQCIVRGSFGDTFSLLTHRAHFINLWGIFYQYSDEN